MKLIASVRISGGEGLVVVRDMATEVKLSTEFVSLKIQRDSIQLCTLHITNLRLFTLNRPTNCLDKEPHFGLVVVRGKTSKGTVFMGTQTP